MRKSEIIIKHKLGRQVGDKDEEENSTNKPLNLE